MWVWARGLGVRGWYVWGGFAGPGGDLLFHALRRSTIGAEGFHGRVRDGIGCFAPRYGHQAGEAAMGLGACPGLLRVAPWSNGAPGRPMAHGVAGSELCGFGCLRRRG